MNIDEWKNQFHIKKNPVYSDTFFNNTLLECRGEETMYLNSHLDQYTWTLIYKDNKLKIVNGFRFSNRLGHFVGINGWKENLEIEVPDLSIKDFEKRFVNI